MRRRLIFADRAEAGALLAEALAAQLTPAQIADPLVLALPRGGVPVAAEVARRLPAPLGVALVRKLGAPGAPELAIGAVADGAAPEIVLNAKLVALGVSPDYVENQAARELARIKEQRRAYEGLCPKVDPAGRTAIIVDDGVATGMTMQAAMRSLRRLRPRCLVAATPVASRDALALLQGEADAAVCLSAPRRFLSVGSFYRSFAQVSEEDVARLLSEVTAARSDGAAPH